ncbi:MAG: MSMEG_0570 family nitrogen starvation response protein [Gammaproteobacteria bacterium]|nr:MSMEG_0570 family nitrogen starvation response protein [Gammaproteobacteria bacterium]
MPEQHFYVRWPDGQEEICYSPSSVINDYFSAGESYPVPEFVARSEKALSHASRRVQEKYGFACSSAMDQLQRIKQRASHFDADLDHVVTVHQIG